MATNRRNFIKGSAFASTLLAGSYSSRLLGASNRSSAKRKPFVLYIHLGSMCGVSSGLVQPLQPGVWQKGFFTRGSLDMASNPLLNVQDQYGALVLHNYSQPLAHIADDVCLTNGTPESLDHRIGQLMQMRGNRLAVDAPEWAMALAQANLKPGERNPICITEGQKINKVSDVSMIQARSIENFIDVTSDPSNMPNEFSGPIWSSLAKRFEQDAIGSTKLAKSSYEILKTQLDTLTKGLPELNDIEGDLASIEGKFTQANFNALKADMQDANNIGYDYSFRNNLILAGIMAKSGAASGMTLRLGGDDFHFGGADVVTARRAAAKWIHLVLFWQWIRQQGLDQDVTIIVSHDFGRSPFNNKYSDHTIQSENGNQLIRCPGRDHGLHFGMLFINKNVPSGGRIGNVTDNFISFPAKDAVGGFDENASPHLANHLVGSMLMRIYPDLFPNVASITEFWRDFRTVEALLK